MRSQMIPLGCVAHSGPGVAGARARELLRRADRLYADAGYEQEAGDKFRGAYLAALRGVATVLALHEEPRRRGRRTRNAWVLLEGVSAEWARWSAAFVEYSRRRAAFEAGIGSVSDADAERLFGLTGDFLDAVHEAVSGFRAPGAA
ncbi:SAV_6107 family HEPN domain-containing protein [Hoyosella sp. YIM 151337]|uniref:SAV_6107 family HEPN domain-containing protein n=1 Tax=Hoyosella sp. YIM 151337 TaxID=2992742 RepID=UPI0022367D4E|nr:SAV_6107 family HEPN domain-containing protein [Hoyosella sp. YIM 151337]MCW4355415.1 SAV_6107 family HEPN domain-containing protein [Hoyosella sp. YIM 151337]